MSNSVKYFFIAFLLFHGLRLFSQNQYNKWYFGNYAGLDFMTNPPTPITGSMTTSEGCAAVSDVNGNLLFYTDGSSIWNQNHAVMPNGTNMGGNSSTTQSSNIVKQPGNSNIYYVFCLNAGLNNDLRYSIVDMNLAAGLGSVTVNGVLLSSGNTEKLTSLRHCNGVDYWILCAPNTLGVLNAFQLTAAGLNTVPIVSNVPGLNNGWYGNMKTSPNGQKIAFANAPLSSFQLCDFDMATGIASNAITLATVQSGAYGVEFSPDCTKLYGTGWGGSYLRQWNLCAGNAQSIVSSSVTIQLPGAVAGMQLGTNGKIYISRPYQASLAVINNPNNLGVACNFTYSAGFTLTNQAQVNLPNFITSDFSPPPGYTYTVGLGNNCNNVSFNTSTYSQNNLANVCSTLAPGPSGLLWNFGDPLSGAANSSTLTSLSHSFTNVGNYTVTLVAYNGNFCIGGNDTITKIITIPFCVSASSQSITCSSLGSATVYPQNGVGPFNYTWMPTGQTSSVATGLNPGTHTIIAYDNGTGLTYTTTVSFASLVPFTGTVSNSPNQPCYNVNTATASINVSGGSGSQSYVWTGPLGVQTNTVATGLGAGTHTVTVTDVLTFCTVTKTFVIGPPPPSLSVSIFASSPSVCVGSPVSLIAIGAGGIPLPPLGFNYTWTAGPATYSYDAVPLTAGTVIYTATIQDGGNCFLSTTVPISVTANPALVVTSVSICPQQTGSLSVSGANSYTWNTGANTTSISASPLATTVYTVTGIAQTCTTAVTASIVLKAIPVATVASNSPVCANTTLNLYGAAGSSYSWTGPFGFVSAVQNPQLNSASVNNSGLYNFTLTAANSCTASAAINVTVNATPALSTTGSTVCATQTINLSANAPAAVSFSWTGPASFTSALQNPGIANPPVSASGSYSVMVTSVNGCTNSAIANVTVSALPIPAFTTNGPKCEGSVLIFNSSGSAGGVFYNWSGPNGFASTAVNPAIAAVSPAAGGVYTLQLTTGPCVSGITQSVTV